MSERLRPVSASVTVTRREDYTYGRVTVRREETVTTVAGEETERRVAWTTPTRGGRRLQSALAAICEEARADNP